MNLLGIEIGGSKLQLVTGSADGVILDRQRRTVDRSKGGAGIREQIQEVIAHLQPRFEWQAVGVGYGGPIDWRTGRVCCSYQVEGWDDFPLADWVGKLTGLPVAIDNDTNIATLAEALRGAGSGFEPVFYTNSGSGLGEGLVTGGKIYHGATPGEAEFGHLRIDKQGTTVEERCSGWAVDGKVRKAAKQNPDSLLGRLAGEMNHAEARALVPALDGGCPIAGRILEETAGDLAFGLSHVVHLFHPQIVVLGGGLALIGEPWRAAVAGQLRGFIMRAFAPGPEIRLAAFREDAVPAGALMLAGTQTSCTVKDVPLVQTNSTP